jgi:hypothetical protein
MSGGGSAGSTGGGGGYQRTNSIPDAENFARGLGVGFVRYPDPDPQANDPAVIHEVANNTNEALDFIRSRGVQQLPGRIEVNRLFFIETNSRATAWGIYVHNPMSLPPLRSNWMMLNRAMVLNPRPEWSGVAQQVTLRHQVGYLSTGDPHHFIYHEFGHFLWHEDNPRRNAGADNQAYRAALPGIRRHVSGRATRGVPEFVSEVFAQMLVGITPVHPDVEQLYRQLGGRVV